MMETGQYAEVNGLQLYYEIHGKGLPLILIHGGGSTIQTTFGQILPLLARKHKVIAVEMQAHGHTADIDRPLTFENDADDVAALMDYLQIEQASILGFSNGGTTAIQIAIRHPHKVDKLIIASALFRRDGAPTGFWESMQHNQLSDMPKELADAYKNINPDPKGLLAMFNRCVERMNSFPDIAESAITGIKAPTLIIAGDKDVCTPEHNALMCRLIEGARLMIIPGGHGDYIGEVTTLANSNEQHKYILPLIEDFLDK